MSRLVSGEAGETVFRGKSRAGQPGEFLFTRPVLGLRVLTVV